ncbi:hypothetical protein BHE74_00052175 [Ensete ventricosum]|nr:hypothetical protein BHE74_00052175 [Ensete ventricosum]RZS05469.1 hypothetical protein BHM03_00035993 [Ensete ventricosum]
MKASQEMSIFIVEFSHAFHFPSIVAHVLIHANLTCPVYDDDELLLLVSKPNHGGGLRFNPIPQEANKDKDEEAYEDEKMKDVEREDEFYSLLWPLALDLLAALMEESFIG